MLTNLHLNCQKRSKKEKFTQSPSATMNVKRINLSKAKKKKPSKGLALLKLSRMISKPLPLVLVEVLEDEGQIFE
jgi:hypothetical protein